MKKQLRDDAMYSAGVLVVALLLALVGLTLVRAVAAQVATASNCVLWYSSSAANPICTATPVLAEVATCPSGVAATSQLCAQTSDHTLTFNANNTGVQHFSQRASTSGADYTNATTTFSNVTGIAFTVAATQTYYADCSIYWSGSAGTAGPKYQWTGPAAPTSVLSAATLIITATTFTHATAAAFSTPIANAGTVTTATIFRDLIDVEVVNGANAGTVQLQAAANGAGTLTIKSGSFCSVQ